MTGGGATRQGIFSSVSNTWHHLLISYPGNGSDMNATRIFVDGKQVDSSSASIDGAISTASGIDLRLLAYDDSTSIPDL